MIVFIIGAVFAVLAVAMTALAVRKHKDSGRVALVPTVLAIVSVLLLVIVPPSIHIVETGEIAVVKHMGEARDVKSAGMHFDLWITTKYDYYDAKVQNVAINTAAYSSDAQTMEIGMTLQYQIATDKAIEIATQYGSLELLENRIEAIAIEKTKSVLSSYKAMDIISDRASMSPRVEEAIKNAIADEYFVSVSTVVLTNIDFSDAFEKAVEDKMIAEQKQLQAEYENKMQIAAAEAKAKAEIEIAKADAEAKLIAAEADRDAQIEIARAESLALQLKSVEVARALGFRIVESEITNADGSISTEYTIDFEGKSDEQVALIVEYLKYIEYLDKWDGKLPTVMTDSGASIIIPTEPQV